MDWKDNLWARTDFVTIDNKHLGSGIDLVILGNICTFHIDSWTIKLILTPCELFSGYKPMVFRYSFAPM